MHDDVRWSRPIGCTPRAAVTGDIGITTGSGKNETKLLSTVGRTLNAKVNTSPVSVEILQRSRQHEGPTIFTGAIYIWSPAFCSGIVTREVFVARGTSNAEAGITQAAIEATSLFELEAAILVVAVVRNSVGDVYLGREERENWQRRVRRAARINIGTALASGFTAIRPASSDTPANTDPRLCMLLDKPSPIPSVPTHAANHCSWDV